MSAKIKHCPECGYIFPADMKIRSLPQHRRYFKVIYQAWANWPSDHARQFTSVEECRKTLQMLAGHKEVGASIPVVGIPKDRALFLAEASIRAAGAYADPVFQGDQLIVYRPLSIAFHKLGHSDFCKLNDEVGAVIFAETGRDPEELLRGIAA